MSTPRTSAPRFASGMAVVPSPHPRSSTLRPLAMPNVSTSASPLSRMVAAMRVKSPFSHSALFGFVKQLLLMVYGCACLHVTQIGAGPACRLKIRAMFPYHDENQTERTPYVTLALIAINVAAWLLVQGAGAEIPLARSVCELGLIPGELTASL